MALKAQRTAAVRKYLSAAPENAASVQAEQLQQLRQELGQLEVGLQAQQMAVEQLTAEKDACKAGAHEASDRSKVTDW